MVGLLRYQLPGIMVKLSCSLLLFSIVSFLLFCLNKVVFVYLKLKKKKKIVDHLKILCLVSKITLKNIRNPGILCDRLDSVFSVESCGVFFFFFFFFGFHAFQGGRR